MDGNEQPPPCSPDSSPNLINSGILNSNDEEAAKYGGKRRSFLSLPVRRLDAWRARRTHFHSLTYADMTPLSSLPQSRFSRLTLDVPCQTDYTFPVDFDLGLFFDSPNFLYITDERDADLMHSAWDDVSSTHSTELREQLYSVNNDMLMQVECSDTPRSSLSSGVFDRPECPDDEIPMYIQEYYEKIVCSSTAVLNSNELSPNTSFIDEEADYAGIRRSSWDSDDWPVSPNGSDSEGNSQSSPCGFTKHQKSSEEQSNFEKHFFRGALNFSPIPSLQEDFYFGEGWEKGEAKQFSDSDWQDCLPSTSRSIQQRGVSADPFAQGAASPAEAEKADTCSFTVLPPVVTAQKNEVEK
uniref:Protein aurora borealis n=1 Tax=Trichuris muris TaxID=70415 RepID=A0A5S6QBL1_TRIMR